MKVNIHFVFLPTVSSDRRAHDKGGTRAIAGADIDSTDVALIFEFELA